VCAAAPAPDFAASALDESVQAQIIMTYTRLFDDPLLLCQVYDSRRTRAEILWPLIGTTPPIQPERDVSEATSHDDEVSRGSYR
jgi:hypothetical protein